MAVAEAEAAATVIESLDISLSWMLYFSGALTTATVEAVAATSTAAFVGDCYTGGRGFPSPPPPPPTLSGSTLAEG